MVIRFPLLSVPSFALIAYCLIRFLGPCHPQSDRGLATGEGKVQSHLPLHRHATMSHLSNALLVRAVCAMSARLAVHASLAAPQVSDLIHFDRSSDAMDAVLRVGGTNDIARMLHLLGPKPEVCRG